MITLKTIRKFRCPFAVCVILSIAVVIGCDLLCDLGILSFSFPRPVQVTESSLHQDQHHASSHGNGHNHHQHSHGPAAYGHEAESEDEDCCDDLTKKFYSSLTSQSSGTSLIKIELFKVLSFISFESLDVVYTPLIIENIESWHLPNGPPGINGQLIRVLIRSFQI